MDVLVISDQPLTVLAMRAILAREKGVESVVDATHMAEAMTLLQEGNIKLIVLDLDTHGVRPIGTPALMREMWPQIPLAILSSRDCDATIVKAVDLGVCGYMLKTADTETLRSAVRQMLEGQVYVPECSLEA